MLAPSYRKTNRTRQRGISLSRTSSLQKLPQEQMNRHVKNINQSFECYEPTSNKNFHNFNNLNESISMIEDKQNQNRLSIPVRDKCKTASYQSNNAKKYNGRPSALQASTRHNVPHNNNKYNLDSSISVNLWHETQSIGQMIQLLVEYEKTCQQQMDLSSAEQARKKINELKKQELQTRRKELQFQGKEYILKTRRQGQQELKEFNQFWEHKIQQALGALKEIQQKHIQQHRKELQKYEQQISHQQNPRVKYSSKVLQIRRNLTSLIKSRKYKQAEHLKSILQKKQTQEQEKWQVTCQQKKIMRIKEFKKRQHQDLEAFKLKLTSSFNQLIKQKQKQEERMCKKMKKKEVESMKTPSSIVRARKNLLNQSKARIQNEDN